MTPFEAYLLPWEELGAFRALHATFHAEYQPNSATERVLVDQLVWIEWRRRRLMLGERSAHLASLNERLDGDYKAQQTLARAMIADCDVAETDELADTLCTGPQHDQTDAADADSDERLTRKGIAILEAGGSYDKALAAIRDDTRGWWERSLRDDMADQPDDEPADVEGYVPSRPNSESLLRFLKEEVMPIISKTRAQAARRPAIRLQAWGESLDPFRMDRVLALDERLTRQFGKVLTMLVRLKELRAVCD